MNETIELLKNEKFKFNKGYGQNFLTDDELLDGIVEKSDIDDKTTVLEIGVGAGTLTKAIARKAKRVIGYEIDRNLKPILDQSLKNYDNIEIVFNDIMKVKIDKLEEEIGENYTLIANLPYYITSPIVLLFIKYSKRCTKIVITIQKEVAVRYCAKENTPDYGSITPTIAAWGKSYIVEDIPRTKFYPQPNVDSAVVRIDKDEKKYLISDMNTFDKLVKCAFLMRRKTFVNNLMKTFGFSREYSEELVTSFDKTISVRGEEFSVQEFVDLSNRIYMDNN